MKGRIKKVLLIFVIILVLLFLIPFTYIKYNLYILETRVIEYLIEDKGYEKSDLKSFKGSFGKLPLFSVWVIFEDEPNIQYQYVDRDSIMQLTYTVSEQGRKNNISHNDIKIEELLHYDSY